MNRKKQKKLDSKKKSDDNPSGLEATSNRIIPVPNDNHGSARDIRSSISLSAYQKDSQLDSNYITEKMENTFFINHWTKLYELYIHDSEFSEGTNFDFIFNLMTLWKNLQEYSKRHITRFNDLSNDSIRYFKNSRRGPSVGPLEELYAIFFFIEKIMLSIEFVTPTGKNTIAYFPKKPACFMLSDEAINDYRHECSIEDANTKMLNLMRNFNRFLIMMESDLRSFRNRPFIHKITSNEAFKFYMLIAWWCSLAINIFTGIVVSRINENLGTEKDWERYVIMGTCAALSAISFFWLVLWLLTRFKQRYLVERQNFKFEYPARNPDTLYNFFRIVGMKSLIQQPLPLNMFFHFAFCLAGIFGQYIILSLNLLLIINISRTTKFVVKATVLHIDQLIQTLILTFFLIFSYTIIISEFYYDTFDHDLTLDLCSELYNCFFFVTNWGLRNGGGIGDSMTMEAVSNRFYPKSIFDVSFFMVVNVISLNIIFGIIIDTFSQLRDEQGERSNPIESLTPSS